MNKLIHFLQYHNAVPIALGIMFMGATGVFAATNPEAIYSAELHVLSVDNTYISSKDFSNWTPRAEITGVTEDAENYYVAYKFSTIDNKEYVWQDVVKEETMTVSKADLGTYRDLGVYVTQQLKQKIDRELARLKETQEIEKRQVSQKMVATAYSGLIGKFLDDTTEVLPGYTPVVTPPPEPTPIFTEALPPPPENVPPPEPETPPQETPLEEVPSEEAPESDIVIQILGDNPARVPVGGTYTDLGAVASNDANDALMISLFVDDHATDHIILDTSETHTFTIRYEATDSSGTASAARTVEIYDPASEPAPNAPATTTPAASTTPAEPPAEEPSAEESPPVQAGEAEPETSPATEDPAPEPAEAAPAPEPASESAPEPSSPPAEPTSEPAPETEVTPEPEPTPEPAPQP